MITGFNHTSFTVADLDRTVRFWTEALGFRAASVSERSGNWQGRLTGVPGARLRIAHLYGHGQHMEFIQYLGGADPAPPIEPNRPGAAHVCLPKVDGREGHADSRDGGPSGRGPATRPRSTRRGGWT